MNNTFLLKQPTDFAHLIPLNSLSDQLLTEVIGKSRVETLDAGSELCRRGQFDNEALYLLEGTVDLIYQEGEETGLRSTSRQALHPLAPGRPRSITVKARDQVTVLRVEASVLDSCLLWSQASNTDGRKSAAARPRTGLFSHIPAANISLINQRLQPIEVAAGQVIMRQGDPGDYYYLLRSGHCTVSRRTGQLNSELAKLGAGDSFGEEELVSNSRRNATITSTSHCVLDRLTKQDFIELIQNPLLQDIDANSATHEVKSGAQWLDVRLPEEYRRAAIDGSINLPLADIRDRHERLDIERTYILVCDSGSRSSAGAFLLAERGYRVKYLSGGMLGSLPGKRKTPEPETRDSEMLAADTQIETAIHFKAAADTSLAAVQAQSKELQTRKDRGLLSDLAGQLKSDSKRFSREALQTEKALQRAQRTRVKLESVLQAFEQQALQGGQAAHAEQIRLGAASREKLMQGEARLEAEYLRASQALEAIGRKKHDQEAELVRRNNGLKRTMDNNRNELQRLERQRAKLREETDNLLARRDKFQDDARKARQTLDDREQRIRRDAEQQLRRERMRLEAEFTLSLELIDEARRRQRGAEPTEDGTRQVRQAGEQKPRKAQERMHADVDKKLNGRRTRLIAKEKEIQAALWEAQQIEKAAREARQLAAVQRTASDSNVELQSRDQALEEARTQVEAAKAAQLQNQISQRVVNETIKKWDQTEDALRRQVREELQVWLKENEDREQRENEALRAVREHLRKVNERLERERQEEEAATQGMFNEIHNMLENDSL